MGNTITGIYGIITSVPGVTPEPNVVPSFDPLYGFPNGRKPRVMIATEDEMLAAKLPPEKRDYCAHLFIKFLHCKQDCDPFVILCNYQKRNYDKCVFDDHVLRMKEYEREQRLRMRQRRKKLKELQAGGVAA